MRSFTASWRFRMTIFGASFALFISMIIQVSIPKEAKAEYGYSSTGMTLTQGQEVTDYTYSRASDGNYFRINSTSSGIDVTLTIDDVNLDTNDNVIYVNYDGSVSSASLTYEIQIRDFQNSVWRNIIPHEGTLANTTDSGTGLLTQLTAAVNNGTIFPIYNGYFTDGSNNPVSTPLTNFISSNQMQIRFLYSGSTSNLELRIDYLSVEPAIDLSRYPASMTIAANYGTVSSGEYNDTTSDDNTTNLQITAGSSGIAADFSFNNFPTPYSDANIILVEFSGFRTTITDYSISIYDYTNTQWDVLSASALTNTSDATNYFATSISQAVTDYISSGTIQIRVSSSSTSGSVTVDYIRVTVGSAATNSGIYLGTVSRGGTPTGDVTNTQTVDTSTTASSWSIPTSTSDGRTTDEYPGDCGTAANSCAAANIIIPVTIPTNTMVTAVHTAYRYSISSSSVGLDFGIRSKRYGNVIMTDGTANATSLDMMVRTASYPMPPQPGLNPVATVTVFQPDEYVNTIDNSVTLYARTPSTSVATAQTMNWDFAFVSIRYKESRKSITAAWIPTGATLTYGTNNASNFRYANANENSYWTISADGTNGTDVYLSHGNVTIPSAANKLIITVNIRWSVASTSFELYLYDFSGAGQWRELTPHELSFTSDSTANREEVVQFEVFDGYFSDGSNNPVSTPLSNFVSSSEVRVRIVSASTSSNAGVDYSLIEFVKDPVYFPSSMTVNNGTVTNEYNDVLTDDSNTNLAVSYSGGLNFDFTFSNVLTPPTGSNAVYLAYSGFRTTITNYTISLRNYGGGSCSAGYEAFNATVLTNTADATNYFIKSVSDWSCYISSNQMQIRISTTGSSGSVTVDFVKLALGSVNTEAAGSSIRFGGSYYNGDDQTRDLDTSQTYNPFTQTWRIRSYPNNNYVRNLDAPSAVAGRLDFPLTKPTNSYPIAIIWMWRGATHVANLVTLTPSLEDRKNYYNDATNFLSALVALNALANGGDTIPLPGANNTVQNTREGWYVLNTPNTIDTVANEITFRFRTSTATTFASMVFDLDAVFIALRYVD